MRRPLVIIILVIAAVVIMAIAFVKLFPTLVPPGSPPGPSPGSSSGSWTAQGTQLDAAAVETNNRGVGLMGRYDYEAAREVFAALVDEHPDWLQAKVNLAIATLNRQREGDEAAALAMLDEVLAAEPEHLQAQYVSGLLRLYLDEPQRAMEHFRFVAERDPSDPYAAYYVAQSHAQRGEYEQALQWYERALKLDPYLRSGYYGIFQTMQRLGRQDDAMEMLDAFQRLADNPRARLVDFVYTRMGPKGEAVAASLVEDKPISPPSGPIFVDPEPLLINGDDFTWHINRDDRPVSITACDITGNGHLDIFIANVLNKDGVHNAVCINQGDNTFTVDADHPLARISAVNAVLWGDYDNDGLTDVYLCRTGPNMLWRQTAENQWEDVTESTGTDNGSFDSVDGLFFDADHDGDLDIFVVNFDGPNELLNNNRDGTFTPIAQEQNIAGDGRASRQVIAVDLEGDRDLDIIVINNQPPHEVYLNDRLWEYRAAGAAFNSITSATVQSMVAADTDADGNAELYALRERSMGDENGYWKVQRVAWRPDAKGVWQKEILPDPPDWEQSRHEPVQPERVIGMTVLDVDGDAQGNLLAFTDGGGTVWHFERGLVHGLISPGHAVAAMRHVVLDTNNGASVIALGSNGQPPVIFNPGPGRHPFTAISFTGKEDAGQSMRSNASGIGTYYAARIGSRWVAGNTLPNYTGPGQSLQPVAIGLGGASKIDFLHIDWPDGIFQSELDLAAAEHHVIAETQRQLSSCPVLWAWDGEKYEFVSDILGVGGMGFLTGEPGAYATSRPWENFMFPIGLLKPKDGRYHIKLGEPMEEACYLDSARLVTYDLPPGWSMTLDERMHIGGPAPTGDARFYRESMLPSSAVNDRGEDVTHVLSEANLQAAPVGEHDLRFIGLLQQDNVITLKFPHAIDQREGSPMLIADGWIEYPYSQTAFAAWQAGATYRAPTIEARGEDGQWRVILQQFGYPAGMPRQMSVPLDDLPPGTTQLRISTNQEIYWDRFMIAWAEPAPQQMQRTPLEMVEATLHRSGFALRADLPQRLPYYDYAHRVPLWDTRHQSGWYTRFGRVEQMIREPNQALAIIGPGEEVHMEFQAPEAPVKNGWTRYHVLESEGWCKDMDLFTRDGETLEPLPGKNNDIRTRLHHQFNTRFESGR